MRMMLNRGHRIRASDKTLVYRFCAGTLLFLFLAVLLLLNMGQLMRTDWEHFSLLKNGLTLFPYNFITILIATGICVLVAFLYYRFCYDSFKKLLHRQKLARIITIGVVDYRHCNQKNLKIYLSTLHKSVQMHIKWECILKFRSFCDRISLLKSVQMHGNGECNDGD